MSQRPARKKIVSKFIIGLVTPLLLAVVVGMWMQVPLVHAQSTTSTLDVGLASAAKIGLPNADIRLVVASVIRAALGFLGVVAVVLILYAGVRWMTAGGNDEQVATSKKILVNAAIGLAIILSAFAITNYVISQLTEAINNAGGNGPGGGGGPNPLPGSVLYVSSLPPSGNACIRNVHPTIVFSQAVDITTIASNIEVHNQAGQSTPGVWGYVGASHTTVAFTPTGSCAPDTGNDCLLPQTPYRLIFVNPGNVRSSDGTLTLNCLVHAGCGPVDFVTGAGVDRLPPTINITSPLPAASLQVGTTIPVTVHFTDDNGVSQISLSQGGLTVGGQSVANCQRTGDVTLSWPTQSLTAGQYTLNATAIDYAAQTGTDSQTYTLRPAACFNGVLDPGETQIDCGGSCGACGGSVCTRDQDCASGYCYIQQGQPTGVCINKMSIQAFSPNSGAPDTLVSVDGNYFGTTPGHVYFAARANPNPAVAGDWIEATLAACGGPLRSWSNYEIIVQVPRGAVSGPLMVVTAPVTQAGVTQTFTDVTNDVTWGPVLNDFQITNQIHPGLCSAVPDTGTIGDTIALTGKNFGLLDNGQDAVFFGDQQAQVSAQSWNDGFISTLVPNSAPEGMNAITVVNNGVESNGVRFVVQSGANRLLPVVNSVSPASGGAGEYVTITGSNFGTTLGKVWFKLNGQGNATIADTNFPAACQLGIWSDSRLLVKVPSSLRGFTGNYTIQVLTGGAVPLTSAVNDSSHFTVTTDEPTPGICLISPASGVVPFPAGQTVRITGEYFGPSPAVYFWRTGASQSAITGRTQADPQDAFSVSGNSITARPPANTESGPVIVYRPSDTKLSNALPFSVGDCTRNTPANTCNQAGYTCCASGLQSGMCVPPGQLCQGQTVSASYIWRFSTRDIPPVPHVVERCDANVDAGLQAPSPSPSVQWDTPSATDSHNVCRTALVSIEFSARMDQSTIDSNSVIVHKCSSVQGTDCANAEQVAISPTDLQLMGNQNYLQLLPPAAGWENNQWYQVILRNSIRSYGPNGAALATDKPCGDPSSAYCFVFRTDQRSCKLNAVLVTPTNYVTKVLESPMLFPGDSKDPVIYTGSGVSDQHCVLMDTRGFIWDWDTSNHTYATIFNEVPGVRNQKVSALGNTVGVGLPLDNVNVLATAATTTAQGLQSKSGSSPLTIDLSDPAVVDYWPRCNQSCTNATVGVAFNVSMSNRNINGVGNPTAVRLLKCLDENCINTSAVVASLSIGYDPASHNTILNIANVGNVPSLEPNVKYQVTVSVSTTVLNDPSLLWSAAFSNNFTSYSKPLTKQFTWSFTTKANNCSIHHVSVVPKNYNAQKFNDKAIYTATPYSAPDQCSPEGQRVNPWSVSWGWQTSDNNIATVQTFSTQGSNPYCTAICTLKGSSIASSAPAQPLCGNGVVEAGEDCDLPNKSAGCGLDCRFIGNSNPTSCGNGVVEPALGEACDPRAPNTPAGACTTDCRNAGSSASPSPTTPNASVCGNGAVGSGEDCDVGIAARVSDPHSAYACSANCLHRGSSLSMAWCAAHTVDRGGFTQNEFTAACGAAVSICGDGQSSPDEDTGCDQGGGRHASYCNDHCLYNQDTTNSRKCTPNTEGCDANGQYLGSNLLYSVPSSCGTGLPAGIGEDSRCESNLNVTHAGRVDPWALVTGREQGVATGTPPAQIATITGNTSQQTSGGSISGSGTFTLMCGFKTDADCQAINPTYGVGTDTCCYPKPTLVSTYPITSNPIQRDVCPNTNIEADFNGAIDPASVVDNMIVAEGMNANAPNVTRQLAHIAHVNSPQQGIPAVNPSQLVVVGSQLYVVSQTNSGELQIYTIDGNALVLTSRISIPGGGYALAVSNGYAYIVQYNGGTVQIVDVRNPSAPTVVSHVQDATMAAVSSIVVDGNTVYVASWTNHKVFAIDVTVKTNPSISATITHGQNGALLSGADALYVENNIVYVGTWSGYFQILNASVPGVLTPMGSLINGRVVNGRTAVLSNVASVFKRGNFVFAASYSGNLIQVIDVSDLNNPRPVAQVLNGDQGITLSRPVGFVSSGNYLFVANQGTPYGVSMIDITNPQTPLAVTSLTTANDTSGLSPFVYPNSLAVNNTLVFVASNAANGGVDVVDYHTYVVPDTTCTTDVSSMVALSTPTTWYGKLWQSVMAFVRSIVGGPSVTARQLFIPSDWCSGSVLGTPEVVATSSSTSKIIYHLKQPLKGDTTYAVILTDKIKDVRGVSIGRPTRGNYNWQFNTSAKVCQVTNVLVTPSTASITKASDTVILEAKAFNDDGSQIQPITNVYDWQYAWGPQGGSVLSVQNVTTSFNTIGSLNKNGEVDVRATAISVADTIYNTSGNLGTGKSHVIAYLCENPWPIKHIPGANNTIVSVFPYSDEIGNHAGYSQALQTFDGSTVPPSTLDPAIVGDGYFNFKTYYCADNGAHGLADDLPYLRPVVQVQNNVVAPDGTLKRFLFTNSTNNDAVGIQVFANPKHLSPAEWYGNSKQNGGQGFVGTLRNLTVDGYKAVRDDNNVYIDAVNYAANQHTLFSNIYLLSINSDASNDTRKVFEQLLTNFSFNTNLTNYGYCGVTVTNPSFTTACSTDADCGTTGVCSVQIDKLKRNYTRYNDFRTLDTLLSAYATTHQNNFPSMKDGSFLTGQTLSVWQSSWTQLGTELGEVLPSDPINKLTPAGTCKQNMTTYCTQDITCAAVSPGDTCVLHDPITGWSTADRRFSFACSIDSYAYRYIADPANGFSLRAHTEDIGMPVANLDSFIAGYNFSQANRFIFNNSSPGICTQNGEITSIAQGTCGDRQINLNRGEQCDPPGSQTYDTSACTNNPVNGSVVVRTCSAACQLQPPSTILCRDYLSPKCGNGKIDPGEQCDDGQQNGTYNHCTKQCTRPLPVSAGGAGYCGDGIMEQGNELCDPSAQLHNFTGWCYGGSQFGAPCNIDADCGSPAVPGACKLLSDTKVKYSLNKTGSCNFDCQSYGPYCGDGILQPEFGEECDLTQKDFSCTVNNLPGTYTCNNRCKKSDDSVVWLKLDSMTSNNFPDSSRNTNHAYCTVANQCPLVAQTVGAVGRSVSFNGTQALSVYDDVSLRTTDALTVMAWISPSSGSLQAGAGFPRILEKGGWNVGGGYALQFWDTSGRVMFAAFSSDPHTYYAVIANAPFTPNNTTFGHVAATFTRNGQTQTIHIYVDGREVSGEAHVYNNGVDTRLPTLAYTGPIVFLADSAGKDLIIGANGQANSYYFNGFIDDVHVYNFALAANQIASQVGDRSGAMCRVASVQTLAAAGTCGDGKADTNEACDNGVNNGQICNPAYGKTCSYCSGDCKNVITVNSTQYCGNAVIEGPELCEYDTTNIYMKQYDAQKVVSDYNDVNAVLAQHGGYIVRSCDTELADQNTFRKGVKYCGNSCSAILVRETNSTACVVCGLDSKNGVTVSGHLLNVLENDQTRALYPQNQGINGGTISLYGSDLSTTFPSLNSNPYVSHFTTIQGDNTVDPHDSPYSADYTLKYYPILGQPAQGEALIGSNPLCSAGPDEHYKLVVNEDMPRGFDFTVKASADPWDYDLLLSPIMSASTPLIRPQTNGNVIIPNSVTPNNVRIVVRWVRSLEFASGFARVSGQSVQTIEDTGLTDVVGADTYFTSSYSDVGWPGIWDHGYRVTDGQLNAEAFTVDTSRIPAGAPFKFYVRAADLNNGIRTSGTSGKLEVDVYFPETSGSMNYNTFSQPSQRYFITAAEISNNQRAPYWHVFDVHGPEIAGVRNRVTAVQSGGQVYAQGRIVTDVSGL